VRDNKSIPEIPGAEARPTGLLVIAGTKENKDINSANPNCLCMVDSPGSDPGRLRTKQRKGKTAFV
jgi:hypothetical protein